MSKDSSISDSGPESGPSSGPAPKPVPQAAAKQAGPASDATEANRPATPRPPGPNKGPNQGQKQGANRPGMGRKAPPPPVSVVEVQPLAQPARMKRRHKGVMFSFVVLVIAPLALLGFYLWEIAADQYGSTTGFTVRKEEGASATDLLGGLAAFTGAGSTTTDSDILYEFIQSQELVESIDAKLDLIGHYSAGWPRDWVFSIWPDATLESLVWFWQRVVRISYDQSSGLIEVRVLAFNPEYARRVASEIVAESQDRINALNEQAREDALRYARSDLEEAIDRLKKAREALTRYRTRTQIVDPATDMQGRLGVMANLQQQLAEALIEYDLLSETASDVDPRVIKARRLIGVIRKRIARERQNFASDSTETGEVAEDYPTLIAEFESLTVDREFAEEAYRAALTVLGAARTNAARQSRYLATYIRPTLPRTSEFPQRFIIMGLAGLFALMFWAILMLVYYSLRDRR
jgi:capsular polysaccharide transport system permease protein